MVRSHQAGVALSDAAAYPWSESDRHVRPVLHDAAIPGHLHFIWIGPELPWFAQLAIASALRACPTAHVTLWTSHELSGGRELSALLRNSRFGLARLDDRSLFSDLPTDLPIDVLARLYRLLESKAARANLARLSILLQHGGVYLDTDTVTLRDLSPLWRDGAFCGLEHVVWPFERRNQRGAYRVLGGPVRSAVRRACTRVAEGELVFDRIAWWYPRAANNAVLGFPANHPLLIDMLQRVERIGEEERHRRYRLGTHLLQEALQRRDGELYVRQLSPKHFYPLGPEVSRAYFHSRRDVERAARQIISEETYVVHWYASVSDLRPYSEARMLAEQRSTLFGHLSARALGY